jgi:hypothetical protein
MRKLTQSAIERLEAKFRSAGTETMVNGEQFVFVSSRYLNGTFAQRISDGRIEQISKGRYISNDLTVRKAIQGYYGLTTFRREATNQAEAIAPAATTEETMTEPKETIITAIAEAVIERQHEQGNEMTITETYEDENAYEVTIAPAADESDAEAHPAPEESPKVRRHRDGTKQAEILRGLQSEEGITIGKIMAITGWKEPSARGILYRVFKKEMGLELTSKLNEFGERVYRV